MSGEGETTKRVRKQTEFLTVEKEEKKAVVAEGSGIALGDYEYFIEQLENFTGADDVLKNLHSLLFHTPGKKAEVKKHLRQFNGFPSDTDLKDVTQKVVEKKKNWTVAVVKDALGLFGLEKSGDREHLIQRLVEYLAKPEALKSGGSEKKKSSSSNGKKRKTASTKKDKAPKKKRAPSAFILFCSAHRGQVKEENPTATFGELTKLVSALWNNATDKEKEVRRSFIKYKIVRKYLFVVIRNGKRKLMKPRLH